MFQYHLAVSMMGKGDKAGARVALKTALSKKPSKTMEGQIEAALRSMGAG